MQNLDVGKTLTINNIPYLIYETEYDENGVRCITIIRIKRWDAEASCENCHFPETHYDFHCMTCIRSHEYKIAKDYWQPARPGDDKYAPEETRL